MTFNRKTRTSAQRTTAARDGRPGCATVGCCPLWSASRTQVRTSPQVRDVPSPDCLASFARCVLSCEGLGAEIEDDDEGALMGFAGSMRANCCPAQLGFAG